MIPILKKEILSFFSSVTGYLVISIYLIINGLFLWVFKNNFNILHTGFADLNNYFFLAPWILMFLIPAITMKSIAEERNNGTIEILKTKPITIWQIVLGKYFGALLLVILAIIPTFIYAYSVYKLAEPVGNLDLSTTFGSFFGLLFLVSAYTSIGIFASAITKNQIVAFLTALLLCFIFYFGFDALANYNTIGSLQQISFAQHYQAISKGVIDTRDIIYFISVTFLFLAISKISIENEK